MKQYLKRRVKIEDNKGQALTEMAIMVPVIVGLLLFSFYFWEIIQVKLKLQEAVRFAAWEFTGYPLHDYRSGDNSNLYSIYSQKIKQETQARYEDLDSSTKSGSKNTKHSFMVTEWELQSVKIQRSSPPNVTGSILSELGFSIALNIEAWLESLIRDFPNIYTADLQLYAVRNVNSLPRRWRFNTESYVKVTVTAYVMNKFLPRSYMDRGDQRWFINRFLEKTKLKLTEHLELVADSWRLNDGRDVGIGERDNQFYNQVERIYLIDKNRSKSLRALLQTVKKTTRWTTFTFTGNFPDPEIPVLVSYNYAHNQKQITRGRVKLQVDGGRAEFDTAPLLRGEKFRQREPYYETLINRGRYFMGCPEPMNLSCGAGLTTENPFGEGVHWPPPQ